MPPTLNKVVSHTPSSSLYSAYSDGKVFRYHLPTHSLTDVFAVYDKLDVIDVHPMSATTLLTCSHNELTLYDMVKNKSLSLKVSISQCRYSECKCRYVYDQFRYVYVNVGTLIDPDFCKRTSGQPTHHLSV